MSELKPCPFCGGAAEHCLGDDGPVICVDCNATAAEAADWNRRHTPEGWQLVPVEMTEDMLADGYLGGVKTLAKNYGRYCRREKDAWKAILHAAPKPPC